jgi:putative MATE family efflux protein
MIDSLKYKNIWKITFPVMLSLVAQNLINLIDTIFLGRVGEIELGASAIGGLFYYGLFIIGFGFSLGAQILISRRNGEKNFSKIGEIFNHSLYFLFFLALIILILVKTTAPALLSNALSSKAVFRATWEFLDYRIWGIFFAFANTVFRAFYVGIMKTKYLGWSAAIMAIVNIILDYFLIFGNNGFPQMGIAGAAIASVIAEACSVIFFIAISLKREYFERYGIFRFSYPRLDVIRHTLEISVYTMLQNFMALGGWLVFFMIVEKSGEHPLAISNIIRSIYLILMIPIWGFSTTTNSLVSNLIGEGHSDLVPTAIKRITLMSFLSTILFVIAAAIFPYAIVSVYTSDLRLINDTVPSLYVILGALILFSLVITVYSGVTGTGNTRIGMLVEAITILIYLVYVYLIIIVFKQPIEVAWSSEYIYMLLLGGLSFLYLRYGKWQKIRI